MLENFFLLNNEYYSRIGFGFISDPIIYFYVVEDRDYIYTLAKDDDIY